LKRDTARYFEDNKRYAGLGQASLRSGVIFVAGRCVNVIVQVGSTLLLARLLGPHDFGLVATVLGLVGFAPLLIDLGTTDAVTQKTQITHDEISTLFWLNIVIGGIMTALFATASSTIALIFGEPTLAGIALVSSLTFILTAVPMQHYALMRRAMEFRRIAVIEISSNVVSSAIAVVMAFAGWGYWALVAKPILQLGLTAIGAWSSCPWLPGGARITPEVKGLVRFGLGIAGFTLRRSTEPVGGSACPGLCVRTVRARLFPECVPGLQ